MGYFCVTVFETLFGAIPTSGMVQRRKTPGKRKRTAAALNVVGASGPGKSTLMNILGCLDRPTAGSYRFLGQDVSGFERDELARLRREAFGFVFQSYNLIGGATATENVEVPAVYAGTPPAPRHERARALLTKLGLGERLEHRPTQLSGGQQQRASIARALTNGGQIIRAHPFEGQSLEALRAHRNRVIAAVLQEQRSLVRRQHEMDHVSLLDKTSDRCVRICEQRDPDPLSSSGTRRNSTGHRTQDCHANRATMLSTGASHQGWGSPGCRSPEHRSLGSCALARLRSSAAAPAVRAQGNQSGTHAPRASETIRGKPCAPQAVPQLLQDLQSTFAIRATPRRSRGKQGSVRYGFGLRGVHRAASGTEVRWEQPREPAEAWGRS